MTLSSRSSIVSPQLVGASNLPESAPTELTAAECARARQARDARFDGLFFVAVKTTRIYCRPICPASPALEQNVVYFAQAISAAQAGFRPCLRCRPDSAPSSNAWLGSETTLRRAMRLIQQGDLSDSNLVTLATRLGVSDRYVRKLFANHLGVSPKQYALYQQCLFAKKLLQETQLAIGDVAFAAGFNSVRRFNDAIKQQLQLTPSALRKQNLGGGADLTLQLSFRPPYDTSALFSFLRTRCIEGLEYCDGTRYQRTFEYAHGDKNAHGAFSIVARADAARFDVKIQLDHIEALYPVVQRIKALFDVDAPIALIDVHLQAVLGTYLPVNPGLRVPGIWSLFEAGVRAILGQQVSVLAAQKLVTQLVHQLGEPMANGEPHLRYFFPTPERVLASDLHFLSMPGSRKQTLHRLSEHLLTCADPANVDEWLTLKGIGPWTVNYVKLRALKHPDVWLAGDAGINNALKRLAHEDAVALDPSQLKPWRSYATLQLWYQL